VAEPIRYYLDQHIPGAVVNGLRQHAIDVLSAQEAGRCGLSDPDQLAFATAQERVLVSFDPDFLALHNAGTPHAGIAWCPATRYRTGRLIQMLILLQRVADRDTMKNRVEYL
jgi:predicted nuclease of predicted toxin-antitoxin system